MTWQDCFELVYTGRRACCMIGGDPEMGAQWAKGYEIRNKATGEMDNHVSMSKYTAEHYANKKFKELMHSAEMMLLT